MASGPDVNKRQMFVDLAAVTMVVTGGDKDMDALTVNGLWKNSKAVHLLLLNYPPPDWWWSVRGRVLSVRF